MLSWLHEKVGDAYAFAMGRPSMQRLNNQLLHLAQRAKGYNNFRSFSSSGEAHFVRLVTASPEGLFIDVGANVGKYSAALLAAGARQVVAFEPLPGSCRQLEALAAAHPDRLTVVAMGAGSATERREIFFGHDESQHATFSPEVRGVEYVGRSETERLEVEMTTLDAFFESRPELLDRGVELLKIDSEGFELDVLLGASQLLRRGRPKFVQLEFNWHQMFRGHSLHRLAQELPGYTAFQLLPHGSGLVQIDPAHPDSSIFHFSNFAFVRDDVARDRGLVRGA